MAQVVKGKRRAALVELVLAATLLLVFVAYLAVDLIAQQTPVLLEVLLVTPVVVLQAQADSHNFDQLLLMQALSPVLGMVPLASGVWVALLTTLVLELLLLVLVLVAPVALALLTEVLDRPASFAFVMSVKEIS